MAKEGGSEGSEVSGNSLAKQEGGVCVQILCTGIETWRVPGWKENLTDSRMGSRLQGFVACRGCLRFWELCGSPFRRLRLRANEKRGVS